MPCDHNGPAEIIAMAEADLRALGEQPASGTRFRFAENHDGYFASVITEIERRGAGHGGRSDRQNGALI